MSSSLIRRIKAASYSIELAGGQTPHPDWLRYIKDVLEECAEEIQRPSGSNFVHTGSQYEKIVLKKMDTIIDALYKLENKPRETNQ